MNFCKKKIRTVVVSIWNVMNGCLCVDSRLNKEYKKTCKSFSASAALFFPPRIVRDWFGFFFFLFSTPFYSRTNERSDDKNNFMWWQKVKETLKLTSLFCSFCSQMKRLYELRPHFTLAFYSFRIYAVSILAAATIAARHSLYKTLCTQSILFQSILNLFFSSVRTLTRYPRFWCIFIFLDFLDFMCCCLASMNETAV